MKDEKMNKTPAMPGSGMGSSGMATGSVPGTANASPLSSGSGVTSTAAGDRHTAQPQQHKFRDALHPHGILGVPDNPLGTEGSQTAQGTPFPSGGATGTRQYFGSGMDHSPAPVEIGDGLPTAGPIHGGEKPKPKDK